MKKRSCFRLQAYNPTPQVLTRLDPVHKVALELNNWHLNMPIVLLPPAKGGLGLGQASLGAHAQWVHGQTFVLSLSNPARVAQVHMLPFQHWAFSVGLLLENDVLPYLQLGPVPLPKPTFLQGALNAYSDLRKTAPPPSPAPSPRHVGCLALRFISKSFTIDVSLSSTAEAGCLAMV